MKTNLWKQRASDLDAHLTEEMLELDKRVKTRRVTPTLIDEWDVDVVDIIRELWPQADR